MLEHAFKSFERDDKGTNIDGKYLNNLRFADKHRYRLRQFRKNRKYVKRKVRNILKNNPPIDLKHRTFDTCILPIITYDVETLTLTKTTTTKLHVEQRKMETTMLGVILRHRVRNEDLRRKTGVQDVIEADMAMGEAYA